MKRARRYIMRAYTQKKEPYGDSIYIEMRTDIFEDEIYIEKEYI